MAEWLGEWGLLRLPEVQRYVVLFGSCLQEGLEASEEHFEAGRNFLGWV